MRKFLYIIAALLLALPGRGQTFPAPMSPPRLVNDFSGVLSAGQQQALETKLTMFDLETSTQIAVVTVDDLQGMDVSDYAARLFDRWGIGRAGKDNGILILVKPKTESSNGQVFISTGYGVEGAVPDILAGRIVDNEMIPAFQTGDYYTGIDRAVETLMGYTRGEFTAEEYAERDSPRGMLSLLVALLPFILIFLLTTSRRRRRGYTVTGGGGGWIPPIIGGLGGFGGFGGGGFGGGGGGGFGGFGGGSSGGGGAGGSW